MLKARINNIDCLVCYDERVPAEKAPPDFPYMYHIRHDEDNWTLPITLERFVLVNFFGTVFMKEPLEFDSSGYIEIKSFSIENNLVTFKLNRSVFEKTFGLC